MSPLGFDLGDVASMFVTLPLPDIWPIPLWFCDDGSPCTSDTAFVTISRLNSCVTTMPIPSLPLLFRLPSLARFLFLSVSSLLLLLAGVSPSPSLGGGKMRSVLPCSLRASRASTSTRLEAPYGAALFTVLSLQSLCFDAPVPDRCSAYSRRSRGRRSWIDSPQPPMFEKVSWDAPPDERPSRLFSPGTRAASCRSDGMHEQITSAQISAALQSSGSARSTVVGLDASII